MVRFKNRYLLVEFLIPSSLSPTLIASSSTSTLADNIDIDIDNTPDNDDDDDDDDEDEDDELAPNPSIPFLVPTTIPKLGEESNGAGIYKAIRGITQQVFGDEGWARLASSFKVIYHSSLTTLTFLRIARAHYRLLWSSLTFLTTLSSNGNGVQVIPRVITVSGTVKKLQNRGISYHRMLLAQVLAAGVATMGGAEKVAEREREEMSRVTD